MTEQERILQEISDCTNEIESLITQKGALDIQSSAKRIELKEVDDSIADIQSLLIKENQRMKELEIIINWLNQEGE